MCLTVKIPLQSILYICLYIANSCNVRPRPKKSCVAKPLFSTFICGGRKKQSGNSRLVKDDLLTAYWPNFINNSGLGSIEDILSMVPLCQHSAE